MSITKYTWLKLDACASCVLFMTVMWPGIGAFVSVGFALIAEMLRAPASVVTMLVGFGLGVSILPALTLLRHTNMAATLRMLKTFEARPSNQGR